jgi:hypothetical protein
MITLVFLLIILQTIGCIENDENAKEENETSHLLTVTFGSYQLNYTLEDLENFESYSGTGGYIKTKMLPDSVVISDILEYEGVRMTTLLEVIPDIPDDYNVIVFSSDEWTLTYSKNETLGDVDIYDKTRNILSDDTAVMIIAYMEEGSYYSEIDPENEIGPLRIAYVGENAITSSSLWSKMVVSIDIISV